MRTTSTPVLPLTATWTSGHFWKLPPPTTLACPLSPCCLPGGQPQGRRGQLAGRRLLCCLPPWAQGPTDARTASPVTPGLPTPSHCFDGAWPPLPSPVQKEHTVGSLLHLSQRLTPTTMGTPPVSGLGTCTCSPTWDLEVRRGHQGAEGMEDTCNPCAHLGPSKGRHPPPWVTRGPDPSAKQPGWRVPQTGCSATASGVFR